MKKIYLLAICSFLCFSASAQSKSRASLQFNRSNKEKDLFLKKQWWLGLKGGPNLSSPIVDKRYAIISPTNYDVSTTTKKYTKFEHVGSQIGLEVTFYFRGISLSFQPTYRRTRFDYSNRYQWLSTSETNQLFMNYNQIQRIEYLDLPLVAKYEFGITKLRPYIQGGIFSAALLNATKTVEVTKTDFASGSANEVKDEPIIVGATDLFAKNHWGLLAGGGLNYNVGNVRLNLDIQYKLGMTNITDTDNRFGNDRLSGVGDASDDLKLNTVSVTVGCLFPLRFLEKGFKSLDKK